MSRTSPPPSADTTSALPRPDLRKLLALFVVSRGFIYAVALAALIWVPKPADYLPPRTVADWFLRWDALWYWDVAEHGYHFAQAGDSTNVVFFPLYAWALRAVSLNGLIDYRFAGYLVSGAGLWTACLLLWRLAAREWRDTRLADLSVVFLLFGPVSFFFSTLYSESWFLPLTIGCLAAARDRRWWLAGGLGALAAFTRFIGIALVVPLVWEWARTRWSARTSPDDAPRRASRPAEPSAAAPAPWATLVACGLPVAGFAAYCGVMAVKFGDPLLYFHAQQHWGRHFTWFWGLFTRQSYVGLTPFYQIWFAGAVALAFALLLTGAWKRIPTVFSVFALTFTYIYISANGVEALPRYFSVVFPFYFAAALLVRRHRGATVLLLMSSIALETLSVVLFVNGYWFT